MPHSPLRVRFPTRRGPGSVGIATAEPDSIGPGYRELGPTIVRRRPSADRRRPGAGSSSRPPASSPLSRPRLRGHLPVSELADAPRRLPVPNPQSLLPPTSRTRTWLMTVRITRPAPHFTETTARPFLPRPRHRSRPLRLRTLAAGLSPAPQERLRCQQRDMVASGALRCGPAVALLWRLVFAARVANNARNSAAVCIMAAGRGPQTSRS